jgi:hypothetical protein
MYLVPTLFTNLDVPPHEALELNVCFVRPMVAKLSAFCIERRILNKQINSVQFFLSDSRLSKDSFQIK